MADLNADPPGRARSGYRDRRGSLRGRGTVAGRGRVVPGQGRQHLASEQAHRGRGGADDGDQEGKAARQTAPAASGWSALRPSRRATRLGYRSGGRTVTVHIVKYNDWNEGLRAGMLDR